MSADFVEEPNFGSLLDEWVIPPFSVLDTRQGYWQARRRRWLAMGMQSEVGRDARSFSEDLMKGEKDREYGMRRGALDVSQKELERSGGWGSHAAHGATMQSGAGRELQPGRGNHRNDFTLHEPGQGNIYAGGWSGVMHEAADFGMAQVAPGTSIFDPVLCEIAYRWWCRPGGTILDPFAGGSVRGLVAASMGHPYIGIDLSQRQVNANREQAARLLKPTDPVPEWIVGDSLYLDELVGPLEVDLVFSCPPYYDLEVYSDHPADLSAMGTYAEFVVAYRAIIAAAVGHLVPDGFAALVVSEVRGPDGPYVGLVPDTIAALNDAGAAYYNEAILVNSAGSLPLRVGQYMKSSRKLGRTHQNVLVGRKGAGSTRGWDHQREDPADPQLSMWDALA